MKPTNSSGLVSDELKLIPDDADDNLFDSAWYRSRYPDVDVLDADPFQHFVKWGRLLERSPGPRFDTKFYLSRYNDVGSENPLQHYLSLPNRHNRPVTLAQMRTELQVLVEQMNAQWQPELPATPRSSPPVISYCIPLLGRLGDIQGTLAENLDAHKDLVDHVEFVIVLFGDSRDSKTWIHENFGAALSSGLLRVLCDHSLDSWHFGKAKNAFRPHVLGSLYSSLDGDNFVTKSESLRLLELNAEYEGFFLLHHFSGMWGDGTSGRISLPSAVYRSVGYDEKLLPRQYDEIDLILRALQRFPSMPFLHVDAVNNLFKKSFFARKFFDEERLPNRQIAVGDCHRRPPLNPRGDTYTLQSSHINSMGNLNATMSGFNASSDPGRRDAYLDQLTAHKYEFLETMPRELMLATFFQPPRPQDLNLNIGVGQICAFLVIKNEAHFLPPLLAHYRRLGVTAFFLVDDGSDQPVKDWLTDTDVHVFEPKVGTFRTLKTAWVEALMSHFLPESAWALTIDADEFIHLPPEAESFGALATSLNDRGYDFMPGLMIDLVPAPDTPAGALDDAERNFLDLFTHCGNFDSPPAESYKTHSSIAWAFGPHANLSWQVDVRHHAFGTFDSLRKIPFLRWQSGRHLNQGYHTLHRTDGCSEPGHSIWERPVLPVHHYKLVRLFSQQAKSQVLREVKSYHPRTSSNLVRIFGGDGADAIARLRDLAQVCMPALQIHARLFQPSGTLTLRI